MKYPVWFPFPVCWLRSFLILLEAQLAALVVMVAFLITSLPAALTSMAYESVFVFWMIFWGVVPPVYLFAQCDRLIWHRPQSPRSALAWLPGWKSWLEGMFAYGGLAIAASTAASAALLWVRVSRSRVLKYSRWSDRILRTSSINSWWVMAQIGSIAWLSVVFRGDRALCIEHTPDRGWLDRRRRLGLSGNRTGGILGAYPPDKIPLCRSVPTL